ncbi:zinc-ribbon and DUF3426 domain-containing protein [Aquabacterium sp.]|uniref:zinc-ribbon and DUF3426 domain-containing protein n=1 Tax=Aquabacterium sp. TaxID=1872578 RepID=UPI002C02D840|nr:zinc-ribbon and DUF3426 domain-containing protein [Aquabacterium sp.]HSW08202.1 zinc-ribbon and DUF3426 domain-containing protein [Aquabacterium sp.]
MSLATRCTECGTVFRVVQDQLKVSEGWVRCGRCSAVFNALENLCDIDAESGAATTTTARFETAHVSGHQRLDGPDYDADFISPGVPENVAFDEQPALSPEDEPLSEPSAATTMPFDDEPGAIVNFSSESTADAAAQAPVEPGPAPQFVQAAERAAFWRRTPVRAGLAVASVLLGVLLVTQLALANRDLLAAHLPAARPALLALCQLSGCRVQPLRRIDRLSVDSSGLARVDGAALYRLSVVLHNRAETALQAPALDLSLTDAAGKLVVRRVLQGMELGLPPVIEAGQEVPLQTLLATGDKRITGYTVELFYP